MTTMDTVTMVEDWHSNGIGNYKSAIIMRKVDSGYWRFVPLRTIAFKEANFHYQEFNRSTGGDHSTTMVYCDNAPMLLQICRGNGCSTRLPPPGHARHNPIVERTVGLAIQGISCALATGGLPNVFWSIIGRAVAF